MKRRYFLSEGSNYHIGLVQWFCTLILSAVTIHGERLYAMKFSLVSMRSYCRGGGMLYWKARGLACFYSYFVFALYAMDYCCSMPLCLCHPPFCSCSVFVAVALHPCRFSGLKFESLGSIPYSRRLFAVHDAVKQHHNPSAFLQ